MRALHERTDGVPLFVSSVITEVMEPPADDAAVGARLAAVAVPENLAAIIDHHIARLDDEQRALLAAAAVCGVRVPRRHGGAGARARRRVGGPWPATNWCASTCGSPRRVPRDGDEALEPPYSFRHALFRQVLYERTPPSARTQLHREVGSGARTRARRRGRRWPPAELAMHFDRGRQPMAALRYYAEAAQAALLNFSPATCIGLTERASALLPQAPQGAERDALEITLATLHGMAAFQALGVGGEARNAFERAYTLLAGAEGIRCAGACCTASATC